METNMEIFPCDKIIYQYLGKQPMVTQYGELNHLLIYHCLDVAAVGHVFLQEHDIYLSKMTQATGLDKKESLSLITFYLTMHDLGKFSNLVQNRPRDFLRFHSKMGFHLWSKIWKKIWHDNLFGLDQSFDLSKWKNLFEPWSESVMNHHKDKYKFPPQDIMKIYFNEDDKAAACCFVKKSAELLLYNNSETQKEYSGGMEVSFNSNSKLLKDLTWMSDEIGSEIKRFMFSWDEVPGNDSVELIEFLIQEFGISWVENGKIKKIDNGRIIRVTAEKNYISLVLNNEKTKVNLKIDDGRSVEFIAKNEYGKIKIYIKCFEYCSRIMPIKEYWDKVAIKQAKNTVKFYGNIMSEYFENPLYKYESELRQQLKNDYSLSNPAKILTSGNLTKKDKISKNHVDEKFDRCLFEILRSLRNELTNGKHHLFFPNESLKAMATSFPQNLESFKKITGTGKNYEKYGKLFLEKIVTYCKVQETNSERCYPTELQETLNLCKQNLTLEEIAQKTNLEVDNIVGHIEELIYCGAEIPRDKFVNAKKLDHIMRALSNIGYEKIERTIREKYGAFLTNEEIRFVKAYKIRNDK